MKKALTYSLAAISTTAAIALSPIAAHAGHHEKAEAAHEHTTLKAVKLDAAWCGSCKAITPKMAEAKANNDFENVHFATIDYTNKDKKAFWADADALGMKTQLKEFLDGKPKTGLVILFDTQSNQIVDVITKADSPEEMAKKLMAASV